MKFWVTALAMLCVVFASAGCTPKSKKKPQANVLRIKGDPMEFIANRNMTRVPTIRLDQMNERAKYQATFYAIENVIDSGRRSYASGSVAAEAQENADLAKISGSFYSFRKVSNGGAYELTPDDGAGISFHFQLSSGKLKLTGVSQKGRMHTEESGEYTLHNYSSTPDGRKFSLLLSSQYPNGKSLMAFRFYQAPEAKVNVIISGEPYKYLKGRGVKIGVNASEGLPIVFCAADVPEYLYRDFVKMTAEWSAILSGRLTITTPRDGFCPSFDDVNTRTYNFVDAWVEHPGPQAGVLGQTLTSMDLNRGEIGDSDIFILTREIQESLDYHRPGTRVFDPELKASFGVRKILRRVGLHEVGHMLGLDDLIHEGIPSIMSYADEHNLRTYDREAVQALYPLRIPISRN